MFSEEQYQEELPYLVEYVQEDWLGFSVITGTAAALLGAGHGQEEEDDLVMKLVTDLLGIGAQAGDLTEDPAEPFKPWNMDAQESLSRIRADLKELDHSPESGDVCWITMDRSLS